MAGLNGNPVYGVHDKWWQISSGRTELYEFKEEDVMGIDDVIDSIRRNYDEAENCLRGCGDERNAAWHESIAKSSACDTYAAISRFISGITASHEHYELLKSYEEVLRKLL